MTIIPTVDELTESTVMRNMRKLAQGVDKNFNEIQTSVDNAVETANNAMEATEGFDDRITDNATAIQNEVTARQNADEAEADARAKADITGIATAISSGAINVTLNRELGALSDSVTGPFIKTATLIPSATDRAFKLQFQYWDDTTYTTNDFVIPEGGGTDVSVSGVTVSEGDNDNEFKVSIQLDDATTIDSNSYPFPESVVNPYPTNANLVLSGDTLNLTIELSNSTNVTGAVDLSAFLTKTEASTTYATKTEASTTYATKTEVAAVDEKVDAIDVTSEGNNVTVNGSSATIVKSVSGQVADGNLKITVNGVESGDIPLPDTGLPIITIAGSISTNNDIEITASPIIKVTGSTNVGCIDSVSLNIPEQGYIAGKFPNSLIQSLNNGLNTMIVSRRTTALHDIQDDFNIELPATFPIKLSAGSYKMPIDGLLNRDYDTIMVGRKESELDTYTDDECIEFTVSNYTATVVNTSKILPASKFKYISSNSTSSFNKIRIIVDRIIKI